MTDSESVVGFNNCGRSDRRRDHGAIYGQGAFYDLNTTGVQASQATNLSIGQTCVVATRLPNDQIVFKWYSFLRETLMPDNKGTVCRVLFGDFLASQTLLKSQAAHEELYSAFFDVKGRFKQRSTIPFDVAQEHLPTHCKHAASFPPEEVLIAELHEQVTKAYADSPERRRERLENAPKQPAVVQVTRKEFRRNADVVVEVMLRANGVCEACGCLAPFVRASDGTPYLEIHHVLPLADGGDDAVENAVALCPNCHRKKHFG